MSTPPPLPADALPPSHPPPPEHPEVPHGVIPAEPAPVWPPGVAIGGFLAAFVVASLLAGIPLAIFGKTPASNIIALAIQDAVLIAMAVFFASLGGVRVRPRHFGLRPTKPGRALGLMFAAYVAFVIFTAVWLSAVGAEQTSDDLPKELGATESDIAAVGVAFVVCVMAPLAEEMLFRGYLYGALRRWNKLAGAVIVGLLFGGVHAFGSDAAFLVPLAFLGFLLCLLYERTGSLYPCIALHCINNCIAYSVTVKWDWQIPVLMVSSLAVISALLVMVQRLERGPAARPGTIAA